MTLSIAIVLGSQVLYPGGSVSFIVTAVVGGAIITEGMVQGLARRTTAPPSPAEPAGGEPAGDERPPSVEEER